MQHLKILQGNASIDNWLCQISQKPYLLIVLVSLASCLLPYVYFWENLDVLFRFWDGPHYMYVAKTFYFNPEEHPFTAYNLPQNYFACHLPMYPILIRIFATFAMGNYEIGMTLATVASTVGSAVLFYNLLRVCDVKNALPLALTFCLIPPRWLIYNSVGATEPLFFCFLFGAFIAYYKNHLPWLMVCLVGLILTRITGILLVPVFMVLYAFQREWWKAFWVPWTGLALLALFTFYHFVYGDFFSYFSWNLSNQGLIRTPPFLLLHGLAPNASYYAAELYVITFLLYGYGVFALWDKYKPFFLFALVHYVFCTFIFHSDLSRYLLAIAPFAIVLSYQQVWTRKSSLFIIPVVIYLSHKYILEYIPHNLVVPHVYEGLLKALHG